MGLSPLSSKQVLEFLPLNTWTEVVLLPSDLKNVYIVTTKDKMEKREKDMQSISLQSSSYDKVTEFKELEIVAVEIGGKWFRGKLISFNEFQTDNTRIELVDYGSVYQTKLENLFVLPYYFMYGPLALPVTFKDFIPKKTTFSIKPLLSESNLHEGAVLVDVKDTKLVNGVNEKQLLESKKDIECANGPKFLSVQNITNGHDHNELSINFANDSKIISVQNNVSNGHDKNETSLYLSSSSRKGSFFNEEKLNNVPFKNKDYCILTYFEDLTCLYAAKAIKKDNDGSYDLMDFDTLQKTAFSTDKILKNYPVVGDIVKVFSTENDGLYRAKILKNNNNGKFDVFYIDYGNIEIVKSNVIYELADELKKPGIAVKIGLSDLKNIQTTEEIKNLFLTFCDVGKPFVIEFDENSKNSLDNVKLIDIENGLYINSKYLMKFTSIQSELTPVQTDKNTSISLKNTNHLSDLKNNDIVFLRHFEDMQNVYILKNVQLSNDMMLKFLQDKTAVCKKNLNVGDIVKIVVEGLSQYRAKIQNVDTNLIYVQNIDFGYCEFVEKNSVCELSDDFKIPGFAIKIGIKGPYVEKTHDLKVFIRGHEKTPLYLEFDEGSSSRYQEITLRRKDNSENIFEEFLKLNTNQLICNDISNNCENHDPIIKSNASLINDFPTITLRSGDYCLVSYFKDFKNIYLCKAVKSCVTDDYEMQNLPIILKTLKSEDRSIKINPVIGDIIKVYSHTFDGFYRAKILNIDYKDFYVSYIDFGNIEKVHSADIFELSDELRKEIILPVPVSIEVPTNAQLTDEIQNFFTNLIDNSVVLCIENKKPNIDRSENIILKELKSGNLVNTEVLKLLPGEMTSIKNCENSTLAHFEDVKRTYVAKAHNLENVEILKETIDSSTAENAELKIEEHKKSPDVIDNKVKLEPLKNREMVRLRYFYDLNSIFVSRDSEEDQFNDVTERTFQDTSKRKKLNIEIGDIVKAMFEGGMYRAKIIKKVDENHFYISFIDFGNDETVTADEIYELPEELKKIPGLCVKIGIKGSLIVDKSNDLVSKYLEELESQLLYIEYDEENPNGLKEASLKRINNNCDIFDELCTILDESIDTKEESIQKPQNTTENKKVLINSPELGVIPNVELRTGDTVFCTHFEDFNHLYLCKGSKNNTTPDNFSVILNSNMKNDIILKENPKYKDIVSVKFEENILRAKVLSKCGKKYSVFLMDIGKNIDVLDNNIFELPSSLKNIPGLAHKVGLKGTTGFSITTTVKDYFYNLWKNDPVPLILRYDEGNFNYLNEVSLIKQSSGQDIVDDLVKIFSTSENISNKPKLATSNSQVTKSNGSNIIDWQSGDHVEFLYGNNVDNINVRKIKLYEEFKNVLDQLKGENTENFKPIAAKMNDVVAIYSTRHEGIYRAKVKIPCFDNTNMVKCFLIDIGHVDLIPSKNIFALPNYVSLNKIPIMVRRVVLSGLNKILNSKITQYLSTFKGKTFVIEYDKKCEPSRNQEVVLKELQSNVSLNDEVQKLFPNDSAPRETLSQQRRLERKIILPETKESPLEKPSHPIKSGSSVFITNFENFNSIFLRDASYEFIEKFNAFNKQMLKYFRNASNNIPKEMLNIGDKVCVKSLLNVVMHSRAQITDIIDNEYNVFYLDYGNTEIVNAEDIMDLPKELEKFQDFVIKVQLQNMPPLKTQNEIQVIKNYFKKTFITPNATLSIEFNEFNPKGLDDVVLRTEYYNKDIVEDIRGLLNAPPLNIKITGQNKSTEQQTSSHGMCPYPARRL